MSDLHEYETVLPGGFPTTVLLDEQTAAERGLASKSRVPANKSRKPANKAPVEE